MSGSLLIMPNASYLPSSFTRSIEDVKHSSSSITRIRFHMAERKAQQLFTKWISMEDTQTTLGTLINAVLKKDQRVLLQAPSPNFITNRISLQSSMLVSPSHQNSHKIHPATPPKSPNEQFSTKNLQCRCHLLKWTFFL